jgi:hypothetical protein
MTPEPASVGSVLDLIFEVTTGARVRARATVRTSRPGEGMGVKFVHIGSEDRSRLNHFLKRHLDAGNIEEDLRAGSGQPTRETEAAREAILAVPCVGSRWEMILLPLQNGATPVVLASRVLRARQERKRSDRQEPPIQTKLTPRKVQPAVDEKNAFDEELRRYVAISEKSTYYRLVGVPGDCDKSAIKQSFYALARKFHPDRHVNE